MKKKEAIIIPILTLLIAFMDITGVPASLFMNLQIADIDPMYFTLMLNFVLIGVIAYLTLHFACSEWKIGLSKDGLLSGLRKYGAQGAAISLLGFVAFYVGLMPFDASPSVAKVLIEGVVYYIGVAIIEELYIRGLLLNYIEKLFGKSKNGTMIAVIASSVIFGLGHIPGTIGMPPLVTVSKVVWTIGMGIFFGMIYKRSANLWVPIIIHFLINVCAIPYCFSSVRGYADITLYIIVPAYIILGVYSIFVLYKAAKQGDSRKSF